MARRRFFVGKIHHQQAELTGEQAHHMTRVLRVEAGQKYEISDNERVFLGEVSIARKDRVVFDVLEEVPAIAPPFRLTLLVALIKFDRFELLIEKATELGVERIAPFIARRSDKGLDRAAPKRAARWRKIALEASQQSRRVRLPELDSPVSFASAVATLADTRLLLDEDPAAAPIRTRLNGAASSSTALLIGPEGGWVDEERDQALAAGWLPVSLGPQILRAETAAIAAAAVLMCG